MELVILIMNRKLCIFYIFSTSKKQEYFVPVIISFVLIMLFSVNCYLLNRKSIDGIDLILRERS